MAIILFSWYINTHKLTRWSYEILWCDLSTDFAYSDYVMSCFGLATFVPPPPSAVPDCEYLRALNLWDWGWDTTIYVKQGVWSHGNIHYSLVTSFCVIVGPVGVSLQSLLQKMLKLHRALWLDLKDFAGLSVINYLKDQLEWQQWRQKQWSYRTKAAYFSSVIMQN